MAIHVAELCVILCCDMHALQSTGVPPNALTTGRLQGTTVVVVEDDDALRSVVERSLLAEDCTVRTFGTPVDALGFLSSGHADLLLADLGLPEMDGLTLIKRAREVAPALSVLVMTGWETAQSAIAAADLGVDGYLCKPFALKRLIEAARRAVGRQQLEQRLRILEAEQAANAARIEALQIVGRSLPHELHQPLSCIMGYAALLTEDGLAVADVHEYATEIVEAAERLSELVRKLEAAHTYAVKEYGAGNVVLDLTKASPR
jgi:CheY-like chemotaxis protein